MFQEYCYFRGVCRQEDVLRWQAVAGEMARHPLRDPVSKEAHSPQLYLVLGLLPKGAHCLGKQDL